MKTKICINNNNMYWQQQHVLTTTICIDDNNMYWRRQYVLTTTICIDDNNMYWRQQYILTSIYWSKIIHVIHYISLYFSVGLGKTRFLTHTNPKFLGWVDQSKTHTKSNPSVVWVGLGWVQPTPFRRVALNSILINEFN